MEMVVVGKEEVEGGREGTKDSGPVEVFSERDARTRRGRREVDRVREGYKTLPRSFLDTS